MNRIALLGSSGTDLPQAETELLVGALAAQGIAAKLVDWRWEGDWRAFDGVLIRSTWDYHLSRSAFLAALETVAGASVPIANPVGLVRWNSDKRYLLDLTEQGLPVVPTRVNDGTPDLAACRQDFRTKDLVLKPSVGASAYKTYRTAEASADAAALRDLEGHQVLVQPYIPEIATEGEVSLIYFSGSFSHAVRKRPGAGDFRVQEELGGTSVPHQPAADLLKLSTHILRALPEIPLYARLDIVRHRGTPLVMEVELIEPVLFLELEPAASERFARAVAEWVRAWD